MIPVVSGDTYPEVMREITYVQGDATAPQGKGVKVIVHVCNDLGSWGKGFVLALSRRWPEPEAAYRRWHRERADNDFGLGAVQFVQVSPYVWVANMVGQHGIRTGSKGVPVRYEAIDAALGAVADRAVELGASVHMPRIGCGLAGGKWSRVEPLIADRLLSRDIPVTVYDFD
jgi:O-acetyl-ADP-ribose deacetylase (regulator of RNase III)